MRRALQLLARLEVVGEALEDDAERAALLAGGDDAAIDVVELARRGRQRARERRAGVDLAAQVGDELALARVLGLVGERGQRALERQARADQAGELARPDGEPGGVEDPAREAEAGRRRARRDDLRDRERHQRLGAQLRARRARVVGVDEAALRLAGGVERFESVGRHFSKSRRPGAGPPQGRPRPLGGQRRRAAASVGVIIIRA